MRYITFNFKWFNDKYYAIRLIYFEEVEERKEENCVELYDVIKELIRRKAERKKVTNDGHNMSDQE